VLGATAEPEKAEKSQDHDHDQDDHQNAEDAPPYLDTGRDSFFLLHAAPKPDPLREPSYSV